MEEDLKLEPRERAILEYIHAHQTATISEIAKHLKVSNKTISNALKDLDFSLKDSGVRLIRKPNVGVSLESTDEALMKLLETEVFNTFVPETQNDRLAFIIFSLLKKKGTISKETFINQLFISKSTLEKDLTKVKHILETLGTTLTVTAKKGVSIELEASERQSLFVACLDYFYHKNWKIIQDEDRFLQILKDVPKIFLDKNTVEDFKRVADILTDFLVKEKIIIRDESYQFLLLYLLVSSERLAYIENYKAASDPEIIEFWKIFTTKSNIDFSEREAALFAEFLALHKEKSEKHNDEERKIKRILDRITRNSNEQLLDVVVNHIREAIVRAQKGRSVRNPNLQDIKKNYALAFEDSLEIADALHRDFGVILTEDEVAYIALHIQVLKEHESTQTPVLAVLISASGQGVFQFLMARLRKIFPNVLISRILTVQEIGQTEITEDLVLTTLDFSLPGHQVIKLSPILSAEDIENISSFQANFFQKRAQIFSKEFSELISEEFIFLDEKISTIGQAILFMGQKLIEEGYAKEGFIESCLEREKLSFTSLESFATPHPLKNSEIRKPVIAFMRIKDELIWGKEKVKYVFLMCIKDRSIKELENIYGTLLKIIDFSDHSTLLKGDEQEIFHFLTNKQS